MPESEHYKPYYRRFLHFAFADFQWVRDLIIATLISISTGLVQAYFNLVTHEQQRRFWISVIAPYAIVLLGNILIRIAATPRKMDMALVADITKLSGDLEKEKDKNRKPLLRGEIIESFICMPQWWDDNDKTIQKRPKDSLLCFHVRAMNQINMPPCSVMNYTLARLEVDGHSYVEKKDLSDIPIKEVSVTLNPLKPGLFIIFAV